VIKMREKKVNNMKGIKCIVYITALLGAIMVAPALAATQPDLIPTAVWDNQGKGGFLFANETNDITVRINNTGSGDAGSFNVTLEIDSYTEIKTVSSMAAGANINVTFTGYAPTTPGNKTVNVTADKENAVAESNEANNLLSTSRQVYNNGYKGKRWTGGADIATVETYSIKGDVNYSTGNSAYTSANWKNISASWSPADLPLPSAATVLSAKLYVYYNFDATAGALWGDNTTFNGVAYPKAGASHYSDVKGWGSYSDRTYGTLVYNVTSNFNKAENTVTLGDSVTSRNVGIDGMILQVVYSDANEPQRMIWINEGFDLLSANMASYGTDTTETIAYAPFTGGPAIDPARAASARLIAVGPGAGDTAANKSNVIFNSNNHWNVLPPYKSPTQIGIADINVISELSASNAAAIQDNGDAGGMRASTTILAIEYKPEPTPPPVSSGVSLGATIRPAISLVVAPDALDFGELAAGQTSGVHTLTLNNTGGYGISVSAEVNDTASNLFVDGLLLDSSAWSAYSASIASGGSKPAGASLKVPGDYAGVGAKEGTLVFWAEMS
jgi:hypothetical protein